MVRFVIGQQANRFQHRVLQILRFVHDQHKPPALEHLFKQGLAQPPVHGDDVRPVVFDFQFSKKVAEQLVGIALRLEQEDDTRRIAQFVHQFVKQCRLTHAGLGHKRHESPQIIDALRKRRQRLTMHSAEVEISGVRGNIKRLLAQTVES